jgi:hypothetical protein
MFLRCALTFHSITHHIYNISLLNNELEWTQEVLRLQILFVKGTGCVEHEEDKNGLGNLC